jgi:Ca2+-binding EF-hand superfamily protein
MAEVDPDVRAAFEDAFKQFDKDGDGHITGTELAVVMTGLEIKATKAEIDDLISQVDTDGNGTSTFSSSFSPSPYHTHIHTRTHVQSSSKNFW